MLKKVLNKILDTSAKPISGYDAAFLYSETPKSPMHVASLTIVEGSIGFDGFKKNIASKLHQMTKFRQRLVTVPFNLDFPYWADDPNFDLDLQIQRIRLPEPADWETLRELSASIFSRPLDLRRPLWSISFIEGLDGLSQVPKGSVAILAKIHHVMIDGMSGVGLMGVLFSMSPDVNEAKEPMPYKPEPLPNELALLAKSSVGFFKNPLKIPKLAGKTMMKLAESQLNKRLQANNDLVKSSYPAPRTIFNQSISPKRTWGTAILALDRVKVLKNIMNATINDVILAICSGGIRKYLLEKDKLPSQPLVANVPISIRSKGTEKELGNKISNMLIPIATHIEDPIERLEAIQEHTARGKVKHKALGAKTLGVMADAVPFGLANLAAGVYSKYNLNEWHRPPFNVTISNVPGPQFPLYLNGHKVLSILGLTPVVDGLGLIIGVFSYNGQVSITSTSDSKTMPDADKFARYIRESANELEALVLKRAKEKKVEKRVVKKSNPFYNKIEKYLKKNSDKDKKIKGKFQMKVVADKDEVIWQIDMTKKKISVIKELIKRPSGTIVIDDLILSRIDNKKLKWEEAKIQGRIELSGTEKGMVNMMKWLKKIK